MGGCVDLHVLRMATQSCGESSLAILARISHGMYSQSLQQVDCLAAVFGWTFAPIPWPHDPLLEGLPSCLPLPRSLRVFGSNIWLPILQTALPVSSPAEETCTLCSIAWKHVYLQQTAQSNNNSGWWRKGPSCMRWALLYGVRVLSLCKAGTRDLRLRVPNLGMLQPT